MRLCSYGARSNAPSWKRQSAHGESCDTPAPSNDRRTIMAECVKRISEAKLAKLIQSALRKSDAAGVLSCKSTDEFGEGVASELYRLWSDEDGRNFSQEDTLCVL